MGQTNYKQRFRIVSVLCVLLALGYFALFIINLNKKEGCPDSSYWSRKYDSLYVVYNANAKNWESFEKKSKGYYFVNPADKKLVSKFDLKTFVIEGE